MLFTFVLGFGLLVSPIPSLTVPSEAVQNNLRGAVAEVQALLQEYYKIRVELVPPSGSELDPKREEELRTRLPMLEKELTAKAQTAIVLVDQYYELEQEGKNSPHEPIWNLRVVGYGKTFPSGAIEIGPDAFDSLEILLHTKLHEFVHADQAARGDWPKSDKGRAMAELEAYGKELRIAATTGLPADQVSSIEKRIKKYRDSLSEANLIRVDSGFYRAEAIPLREALEQGQVKMKLEGQGVAAGNIFRAQMERLSATPFTLEIAGGTPLRPKTPDIQTMIVAEDVFIELNQPVTTVAVPGYCLDPNLPPPPNNDAREWTVENPSSQPEQYETAQRVVKAGRNLAKEGQFHQDLPPNKHRDTVIQRALWYVADPQGWGKERLHADLVKQVRESGGKQTPEQVQKLTDHLWQDVDLTLKSSRKP